VCLGLRLGKLRHSPPEFEIGTCGIGEFLKAYLSRDHIAAIAKSNARPSAPVPPASTVRKYNRPSRLGDRL